MKRNIALLLLLLLMPTVAWGAATSFMSIENGAASTLDGGISDVAVTLVVQAGEGARFPSTYPFNIVLSNVEIVRCTNRATDTLTITRAQEGTSGVAHGNAASVRQNVTALYLTELHDAVHALEDGSTLVYLDGVEEIFGTGSDTSIQFDGTDFVVSIQKVGTGLFRIIGGTTPTLEIKNSDTTIGAFAEIGSVDFFNSDLQAAKVVSYIRAVAIDTAGAGGELRFGMTDGAGTTQQIIFSNHVAGGADPTHKHILLPIGTTSSGDIGFGLKWGASGTAVRPRLVCYQIGASTNQIGIKLFTHPSVTGSDPSVLQITLDGVDVILNSLVVTADEDLRGGDLDNSTGAIDIENSFEIDSATGIATATAGKLVSGVDSTTQGVVTAWDDGSGGPGVFSNGSGDGTQYWTWVPNGGGLQQHTSKPSADGDGISLVSPPSFAVIGTHDIPANEYTLGITNADEWVQYDDITNGAHQDETGNAVADIAGDEIGIGSGGAGNYKIDCSISAETVGNGKLIFYAIGHEHATPATLTSYTAANPGVITLTDHGLEIGDGVIISGSSGGDIDGHNYVAAASFGANTFTLIDIDGGTIDGVAGGTGGTIDTHLHWNLIAHRYHATGADVAGIPITGLLNLIAGDDVFLMVLNSTDNTDAVFQSVSLSVQRVD